MGWSCTKEQMNTLDRIDKAMGDGRSCRYFLDGPHGGPYGKDYGTADCRDMTIPVYEIIERKPNGQGRARKLGYCRIKPDGRFSLPRGLRKELGL
jgi:hypothetical protein